MRGIFSSTLPLLLPLLFVQAIGAQNVTIDLTPIIYPIVLPDSGGSFDYLLTVTNQGSSPITATVWCLATLPSGASWGPTVGPATQTLAAGQTQSYYRTQNVPPRAAYGYYTLRGYIGIYPDTIWAQDEFEFQHQAISGPVEQEWVARYNGPGNGWDEASSLAVDAGGNVYVTGKSPAYPNYYDYATVKYDDAGHQIWVARYNGPGDSFDGALSLAVDGRGSVYVTGGSDGIGGYSDYATIKYDSLGNQIWVARYNGPGNNDDWAQSLVVDDSGNVFVTGVSRGLETYGDYTTIKYDASGHQIWVARYNGPGNDWDQAQALAIDGSGNVYVTGRSNNSLILSDYATVKYDAEGNQIWVARYDGPGNSSDFANSLAVDESGNVYVTGWSWGSGTNYDYATIKYDAAGNQFWVARYDGPGSYEDFAYSLRVDGGGNVYVTGESWGSGTSFDYATVKYDALGNQIWIERYNGTGNSGDAAHALALDSGGNIYVTGMGSGSGGSGYATIKYDAAGNQIWIACYDGPGNNLDVAYALAVDGPGNVYVTGRSYGGVIGYEYATIKYSAGQIANWLPVETIVLVQPLPQECRLEECYPNPFNSRTTIAYQISSNSWISLRIYNAAGRLVESLVNGWRTAGEHKLTWEAGSLPTGVYFCRIQAGDFEAVTKLLLLK